MEMAESDGSSRIGFALAGAFLAITWLATLIAFCFWLMINTFYAGWTGPEHV
jgi:hypothetical protein